MTKFLWRSFRLSYSIKSWFRKKFTDAGLFVIVISLTAGLFGINTRMSLHHQIFTLGVGLLFVGILFSFRFRPSLEISRLLPRHTTVGEPAVYQVQIKNLSDKPLRGVYLIDQEADPRPDYETFSKTREPWDISPNGFDRLFTYPRWQWLIQQNKKARLSAIPIPDLAPGEQTICDINFTPLRRGKIEFQGLMLFRTDPLGLVKAVHHLRYSQNLLVLPNWYSVAEPRMSGVSKYQSGGVAQAGSVGETEEFVSIREYRPEDSPRRMHWKAWAKTGKPIVKEYQQEYFVRHALVLDTFCSQWYDESFEKAVSIAASYICGVQSVDSLLDLMFVGDRAYCFTSGQGLLHTHRMMEILAVVRPSPHKDFSYLGQHLSNHGSQISSCIFIMLDWDEHRQSMLNQLMGAGIPSNVLVIRDPKKALSLQPELKHNVKIISASKVEKFLSTA